MAKKDNDSVYKVVEVVGTSTKSWAEAGRKDATRTASASLFIQGLPFETHRLTDGAGSAPVAASGREED